jgi:hypothetical protein
VAGYVFVATEICGYCGHCVAMDMYNPAFRLRITLFLTFEVNFDLSIQTICLKNIHCQLSILTELPKVFD